MYKILLGIPVAGVPAGIKRNEYGYIENVELDDDEDIWCDFSVEYNEDDRKYYLSFETLLYFKENGENECVNWIKTCLTAFTDYMNKYNYDTSKELSMYSIFTTGVNVNSYFDTIKDAYAFMKFVVNGFNGKGLEG